MVIVVTGVAGVGKTTVGRRLASRLGYDFVDADDFHPLENVEKMRQGRPLTDRDRDPWLDTLATQIDGWLEARADTVLACSALKRAYRDRLGAGRPDVRIVHLTAPAPLVRERMRRRAHFMPPALLSSQIEALEPPGEAEDAVAVSAQGSPGEVVDRILSALDPLDGGSARPRDPIRGNRNGEDV